MKYQSISDININRTLFMFNDFNQETSEEIVKNLIKLDTEAVDDINIIINSYGGSVLSLFSILDTIKSIKSDVNTICLGEADSCGAVLLAAGKERYIGENSRVMIHEVSSLAYGKVSEMEEDLKEAKRVNDQLISVLADSIGSDTAVLRELMKKDTFLDAEASKSMNIVEFILDDTALEYAKENASEFVDSFSGRARDAISAKILYNSSRKQIDSVIDPKKTVSKIVKNAIKDSLKGVKVMDKKEMINELKAKFNIDVNKLQADLESSKKELKDALDESIKAKELAAKLEADVKAVEEKVESEKIEDILNGLITDLKSTQDLNDSIYRDAFTNMGSEKALEAAKKMAKIVSDERTSSDDANNSAGLTDKEQDHLAILDIVKKDSLSYVDAVDKFYAKKGDK